MSFYLEQQENCSEVWNVRHSFHLDVYSRVEWLGTVLMRDVNTDGGSVSHRHRPLQSHESPGLSQRNTYHMTVTDVNAQSQTFRSYTSQQRSYGPFARNWLQKGENVNLSLSTPWRNTGGIKVNLHSFLTSALDGGHIPAEWAPRAGLDVLKNRCFLFLSEFVPRTVHPVNQDSIQ